MKLEVLIPRKAEVGSIGRIIQTILGQFVLGGEGASGVAKVQDGKVVSITITESGAGYVEAPEILFSLGGWRKLGGGDTPRKDVIVPSGSGILLERNNSSGLALRIPLLSPFNYLRE